MSLRHITDYAKAARAGARIASNPKLKADLLELATAGMKLQRQLSGS